MNPKGIPPNYVRDSEGNWCHPSRLVGGLLPAKPQPDPLPALDQEPEARPRRKTGLVVRVTIIRCGKRLLDCDNLSASYKGLRDGIARSLGIDDGDHRIRWEYGQCETRGRTGTIVKIEHV